MAFNMNRSIIKGTKLHKASIAKAKQSIVSQARMKADPTLVAAGTALGESKIPRAIDFSLNVPDIKIKEKKKKKKVDKKSGYEDYLEDIDATVEDVGEEKGVLSEKDWKELNKQNTKKTKETKKKKKKKKKIKVDPDDSDKLEQEYYNDMLDAENGGTETSDKLSDYSKSKGYKTFVRKQEEQYIREAEELKKRQEEASKARQSKITPIKPKTDLQQIPTSTKEDIQKQSKSLKSTERLDADKNPKYKSKQSKSINIEGKNVSISGPAIDVHDRFAQNLPKDFKSHQSGKYNDYGYTTFTDADGQEHEVWTYKNQKITESEVSAKAYQSIMQPIAESQREQANITPSQNTLIDETTDTGKDWTLDRKPRPGDFEGSFWEKQKQYKIANEQWYQNTKKSPAKMRDDRIFRNAKQGGTLQSNMRKSGYIPPNEI